MITLVNPVGESIKDAFSFRGPGSVLDDVTITGGSSGGAGPVMSAAAGYYFSRLVTTAFQMLLGTRAGGMFQALGDAGIGAVTALLQIFTGRFVAAQFPGLFQRDAFIGGVYVGSFQGVMVPLIQNFAGDNKFLNYLSGAWDSGDFGGGYGAIPQLPMAGEMWQGAYGEQESRLGTAYYEDQTVSGPVPSGYDNAQLNAGEYDDEEMLYANLQ